MARVEKLRIFAFAAFAAMLFADTAAAQGVRPLQNYGWPGGDAMMVCRGVSGYVPLIGGASDRTFRADVTDGLVNVRFGGRRKKAVLGENALTPVGFIMKIEHSRSSISGSGRLVFEADFKAATLKISAESFASLLERDRTPKLVDCDVKYSPFPPPEPERAPTYVELLWDKLREIAARNAPLDAAAPEAPLARSVDDVRAAAEGARGMLTGRPRATLGAMRWFTDSDAGKDYARSPNGRALALGHPRGRCPAIGAAKQALSHSALADAYGACVAALPEPPPDAPVGEACACAAAIVGNVLLADPATFDYEPRPRALLATAAEDGSGLEVLEVAIAGDPDDSAGMRIDDANGREICGGLRLGKEPFELRCVRFGGRYAARAELFGRRGMRGYGAALGIDAARAEGHPRRVLALFFHFEDAALDRIKAELPELWSE